MKKRILALCLALTLCFTLCLVSCNGNDDSGNAKSLTRNDYTEVYTKVAQSLFDVDSLPTTAPASYVDFKTSNDRNYYAVGAFILFLRNLYANESFEVTEEAVKLTASYSMSADGQVGSDSLDVTMRSYRDAETGVLKNDIYQSLEVATVTESMYMGIDIDYDFETDTLKKFDLTIKITIGDTTLLLGHYSFDGTTISILNPLIMDDDYNAVLDSVSARETDIAVRVENAKVLGDFSVEYTNAMITQARIVYPDKDIAPAA